MHLAFNICPEETWHHHQSCMLSNRVWYVLPQQVVVLYQALQKADFIQNMKLMMKVKFSLPYW